MSYYMDIRRAELTVKEGKTKEDVEDILEWVEFLPALKCREMADEHMVLELEENDFCWDEAVYADLLLLSEICDGFMEMEGEEGEYSWFDIKNGVVKELEGKIVYGDEASLTFDANNPILRRLLFEGLYSDGRIIVLDDAFRGSAYILVDRKEVRYMTFFSLTAGLLQLLQDYAKAGEDTLENYKWTAHNHNSIKMKEWINRLNEKGFSAEAVALKLAYQ